MPTDELLTHLSSRVQLAAACVALVVSVLCVVAAHNQSVIVPWDAQLTVRLEPLAPAVLLCLSTWLVTPRRFTLEPGSPRERAIRTLAVLALLPATIVVSAAVTLLGSVASGLLCVRNGLCFLGLSLLLAALSDGRVAGLGVTILVWLTGRLGSDLGPLRDYAWLNFAPAERTAWLMCLALFVVGVVADVFVGSVREPGG